MNRLKRLIVLLALAFIVALVPALPAQTKKPLRGTMDLEFNLLWPEPQDVIPDWVGNITIDDTEYGMLFFAIGSGKAFDDNLKGKVHFFKEIWAIYDTTVDFTSLLPSNKTADWAYWLPSNNPAELVLWGYDVGQTNTQNNNYHMNGNVEVAIGDFAIWQDRNVHMSGEIIWYDFGAPHYAPGTFRVN